MKKFVFGLLLVFGMFLLADTAAADAQNFSIRSFTADYYLSRDDIQTSQLIVTEEIVVDFPDYDQNHGILRSIPKRYQDHTVSLKITKVTDQSNRPLTYTTYEQNDNEVIKIGDPNRYVQGQQVYKIHYQLRNVISFQDTGDEFYWDVNGTEWQQVFGSVSARIHIPKELESALNQQLCLSGVQGASEQNCTVTRQTEQGGTLVTTTSSGQVLPYQTLTFVLGFKKGTFKLGPEVAAEQQKQKLVLVAYALTILGLPLLTFLIMLRHWSTYGRDPKGRGTIIPEYLPPKGVSVMASKFLLDETISSSALSAGLIELAVHGHVVIYETKIKRLLRDKNEYEILLAKVAPEHLTNDQKQLIDAFFGVGAEAGSKIKLGTLKNKLHAKFSALQKSLGEDMVTGGYFKASPHKVRTRYFILGIVMTVVGIVTAVLVVGWGLVLSGVIICLFAWRMPARTKKGVSLQYYLLGIKMFMEVAEKDRITYLQSPAGAEKHAVNTSDPKQRVKLFEELLPYAMIFGIEKGWAKQFKDVYKQPPEWYHGNWAVFNSTYLVSSVGSLNSANTAIFTSPSSSSGSGFGGGFSGGGGGGGGGGGW